MDKKLPCDTHAEKIKNIERRLDIAGIDKIPQVLERLSILMEVESERNDKRDILNEKQNTTLDNINKNLTNLNHKLDKTNDEVKRTNEKVNLLENKVLENEEKNIIDRRDIGKEKDVSKLKQTAIIGIPVAVVVGLIEIIKLIFS